MHNKLLISLLKKLTCDYPRPVLVYIHRKGLYTRILYKAVTQKIFAYISYPLSFPVAGSIVCRPLKSTLSLFDCPRTMFCIHSGAPLYINSRQQWLFLLP